MAKTLTNPAQRAIKKLQRRGKNSASVKLASLTVNRLLERPLEELAEPEEVSRRILALLEGLSESDELEALVLDRLERAVARLEEEEGTLGDWLSEEATEQLLDTLGRPYSMDQDLTLRLLDHEAMRNLVRRVLRETLSNFVKKLRPGMPESRILSGIGRRAGRLTRKPREKLGGMGDGMLGAVGGEVERQAERKVGEFVDQAVGGVLRRIAEHVCDPAHEEQFARMRAAAGRVGLGIPSETAAQEIAKADLPAMASFLAVHIQGLASHERLGPWIEEIVADEVTDVTLGEFLEQRGILEPWSDWVRDFLAEQTRDLARTDEFEEWFTVLLA